MQIKCEGSLEINHKQQDTNVSCLFSTDELSLNPLPKFSSTDTECVSHFQNSEVTSSRAIYSSLSPMEH